LLFTLIVLATSAGSANSLGQLPTITMRDAINAKSASVSHLGWRSDRLGLIGSWTEGGSKTPAIVSWDLKSLTRKTLITGDFASVSPNGRWIAFLDDRCWKLKSLADDTTIVVSETPYRPTVQEPPKWSRNGRYLAILQMVWEPPSQRLSLGEPESIDGVRVIDVGHVADLKAKTSRSASITIVDMRMPSRPATIQLDESVAYHGEWGSGTKFYFVGLKEFWTGIEPYTTLRSLDARTMTVSEIYRSSGFMQSAAPRVGLDDRTVALALDVDNKKWDDYDSLVVIDTTTKRLTRLTSAQDVTGSSYVWAANGRSLYFIGRLGGLDQLYQVDLRGNVTRISRDDRLYFDLQASQDRRWLSYQTIDAYGRKDIRVRSTQTKEEIVLATLVNPAEKFRLGEFQHIRWKSTDNLDIWGYLFLPPDFDANRRYPLYVDVHGGGPGAHLFLAGPLGGTLTVSPLEWHAWSALGYVVFVPDMRSSGEYGAGVARARYAHKDWDFGGIRKDVEDIESGTRWMMDQRYIDPTRVAVFGHSAGAARVNLLLSLSSLYGAAIIHDEIYAGALPQMIWSTSGSNTGTGFDESFTSRGVTFAQDPAVYTGGFMFDGYKSKTPTLILVGDPERGAAQTLSSEVLFSMLRQYKVPSRMLRYVDDGHSPSTVASALNRVEEIRKWLETYIPGTAANR
jgi:dipeptidyl aminopeptidase/acylaminoacyl peptidase